MPDRIAAELRALLAGADSGWGNGFSPGRAYRFTSRARYFAWLVALWVKDSSDPARAAFHTATGETSLRQWQRTTVLQDGAAFVATVARLAEMGCAARWIERFEPAEIVLARQALERCFAIRLDPVAGRPAHRRTFEALADPIAAVRPPPLLAEAIAWLEASGNHWLTLPPSGKALLLAAVILARNPSRSTAQPAALAAAIIRLSEPAKARSDPAVALPQPQPAGRKASGSPLALPPAAATPRAIGARPTERRTPLTAPPESGATPARHAETSIGGEPAAEPGQSPAARAPVAADHAEAVAPTAPPLSPNPAQSAPSGPMPFIAPDARFETGFGGLFFLVNAFIALGLYPDFTQPLGARLDPSPLWLADRIGRYWFGARYRDPLATWIAANAAPGRLPNSWRAEPDWLTGFGTRAALRRALQRGRVTLWHPASFPLIDEAQGRARHRRDLAAGSRRPRVRISPARLPSKLSDRWAACLALYLDARLRLSSGAGLALLALPARVQTRDLDLSARFALDCYPIQLRIAGLDRDPGWQPAEGRSIAFVFE
jgi:hypothetical protein